MALQVAVLFLNCFIVESLVETYDQLSLFFILDIVNVPELLTRDYHLVDVALQVLDGNEVFSETLQELIFKQLQSDAISVQTWFIHVLRAISYSSLKYLILLWFVRLEATVSSGHSVNNVLVSSIRLRFV